MTAFLWSYHPLPGLLALLGYLTVGAVIPLLTTRLGRDAGMEARRAFGALNAYFLDSLRACGSIQYGTGEARRQTVADRNRRPGRHPAEAQGCGGNHHRRDRGGHPPLFPGYAGGKPPPALQPGCGELCRGIDPHRGHDELLRPGDGPSPTSPTTSSSHLPPETVCWICWRRSPRWRKCPAAESCLHRRRVPKVDSPTARSRFSTACPSPFPEGGLWASRAAADLASPPC